MKSTHNSLPSASRPIMRARTARWAIAAGLAAIATPLAAQPTIVLVGAKRQGTPHGEHDFTGGVVKLQRLIKASPEFAKLNPVVKLYPVGFPKDMSEIDNASVVVFYFGSVRGENGSTNPAQDPVVKTQLDKMAARGVGLVALHQSFTVADKASAAPFTDWLGGARVAVSDYSVEFAPVKVKAKTHPIARGVSDYEYLDEYYSAIDFGKAKVTPVLTARTHIQNRRSGPVYEDPAKERTFAWALERPDGGRSFTYAGGHYLTTFDQPQARTAILNAIMWAAKEEVPATGVTSTLPTAPRFNVAVAREATRVVLPVSEVKPEADIPWGKLRWFASRALGNSDTMTIGEATVSVGKENPPHWHPNTDEILHVAKGHIMHRVGDKEYEMKAGDTVVIPEGTIHNARNIGTEDAVLMVSFNSADRISLGE